MGFSNRIPFTYRLRHTVHQSIYEVLTRFLGMGLGSTGRIQTNPAEHLDILSLTTILRKLDACGVRHWHRVKSHGNNVIAGIRWSKVPVQSPTGIFLQLVVTSSPLMAGNTYKLL